MCGCRRAVLSERAPSSLTVSSADLVLKGHMTNSFFFFFFLHLLASSGWWTNTSRRREEKKSNQVILLGRCILKKNPGSSRWSSGSLRC